MTPSKPLVTLDSVRCSADADGPNGASRDRTGDLLLAKSISQPWESENPQQSCGGSRHLAGFPGVGSGSLQGSIDTLTDTSDDGCYSDARTLSVSVRTS
jgi:hypothetical protein